MPTFETRDSISVTIELSLGDVHLIASDRMDTVVIVNPSDPSRKPDQEAAEQTLVEYAGGRLLIKVPKPRGLGSYVGVGNKVGSVDVTVELPTNSGLQAEGGFVDFQGDGQFGDIRIKNGAGNIRLDQAREVILATGAGSITVDRAVGHAEVTGAGDLRVGDIVGPAEIKNLNGKTWIGDVAGGLKVRSANGDITVGRAHKDVAAKTANGNIQIGEIISGAVVLETGSGGLDIGIRNGTAAWIDVVTRFGRVHNALDTTAAPEPSQDSVEVRARTSFGNIAIHRS